MTNPTNPVRGEATILLAGITYRLIPSLRCLSRIEKRLGAALHVWFGKRMLAGQGDARIEDIAGMLSEAIAEGKPAKVPTEDEIIDALGADGYIGYVAHMKTVLEWLTTATTPAKANASSKAQETQETPKS